MGRNDFWSVVSIAAFLGIGVAGYYVIDKYGKNSGAPAGSFQLPDILGWITGAIDSISGTADDGGTGTGTTTPPATTPPGTTPPTGTTPTPTPTTPGTLIFAAAGDWGSGRNSNWKKVVSAMANAKPSIVLVPGDQSYTNPAGFKPVTDAIKKLPAKVFGADGNHDGSGYASNFDAYSNFVQTVGNVSFMGLNSNSTGSAVSYAKANMSKMTAKWKVVFFHHPVYTVKSDHAATMQSIQPVLAEGKVNLCIAAHNHTYQRFAPIDGVTHIVSGLGGESPYPVGAYSGTPANLKKYNSTNGFALFTATPTNLAGRFIDVGGKVIDSYSIA